MLPELDDQKNVGAASEGTAPQPEPIPPTESLAEPDPTGRRRRRRWLWVLAIGLVFVAGVICFLGLGVMGVYDGLKDRAIASHQLAQEHYAAGLGHLDGGDYELAIAEFEEAMRYDSNLEGLRQRLQEAKEMALAQVTPTSQTRRDAATLLYRQAVRHYEGGDLVQAVAVLEELRGLDADYQRENVETMLVTAHRQMGLNGVQADQLDEAAQHFQAVLDLRPDDGEAQTQLSLLNLYRVALSHWEQDWPAAIKALQALYARASDYKDVQARLHNAHTFLAQAYAGEGDWCRASEEYAAAVAVFPLEADVDKRDDAAYRCQATAEAPLETPTPLVTARPTATRDLTPEAGPTSAPAVAALGSGSIAYTSFDAVRQRYDIRVVDLDTGTSRILREMASQPAFATGGSRLAFRNHDPKHLGVDLVDPATGDGHELTTHAEDVNPAWSPDAKQIAFASNKHGDRKWRIYVISPGEVRGEGEELVFGQMPTWAPDNSRIAYHGCDVRGDNCGVWVITAGAGNPGQLSTHPSDTSPSWSPDGSQVAFTSSRTGNWEIYLVDLESRTERRLTDHGAADVAPAWAPDGRRLAFLSNRDGKWGVYVLDVRSSQAQLVINAGDAYPEPVGEQLTWVP